MRVRIVLIMLLLLVGAALLANKTSAQSMGVKINMLEGATMTPNLGVEFGLGKQTTIELTGRYNPWTFNDNKKFKHWAGQVEFRWWPSERFNRHFWGVHVTGGEFNAGNLSLPFGLFSDLEGYRFEGRMVGGGFSYGYQWYLGPRWNLEATLGVGALHLTYEKYLCPTCGDFVEKESKTYFGPTKVGVSFIYMINFKK